MSLVSIMPIAAAILFIIVAIIVMRGDGSPKKSVWIFPAVLSFIFFLWSVAAIVYESPIGFWLDHTRSLWGNQIWFDLLFAIGIAWYLIMPKAKSLGMRLPLWLIFIVCTGCIGLLAMLSRVMYLQEKAATV